MDVVGPKMRSVSVNFESVKFSARALTASESQRVFETTHPSDVRSLAAKSRLSYECRSSNYSSRVERLSG